MIFNAANAILLAAIFYGFFIRKNVALHVRVMKTCFALDIALLLAVEFFRGAVEKTLGIERMPSEVNLTMLWIHIPFAVLSLIFWVVQLRSGSKILKGERERIPNHKRNAFIFLVMRTGNLLTALLLHV